MSIINGNVMPNQQVLQEHSDFAGAEWQCETLLDHLAKTLAKEYVQLMEQACNNSVESKEEKE